MWIIVDAPLKEARDAIYEFAATIRGERASRAVGQLPASVSHTGGSKADVKNSKEVIGSDMPRTVVFGKEEDFRLAWGSRAESSESEDPSCYLQGDMQGIHPLFLYAHLCNDIDDIGFIQTGFNIAYKNNNEEWSGLSLAFQRGHGREINTAHWIISIVQNTVEFSKSHATMIASDELVIENHQSDTEFKSISHAGISEIVKNDMVAGIVRYLITRANGKDVEAVFKEFESEGFFGEGLIEEKMPNEFKVYENERRDEVEIILGNIGDALVKKKKELDVFLELDHTEPGRFSLNQIDIISLYRDIIKRAGSLIENYDKSSAQFFQDFHNLMDTICDDFKLSHLISFDNLKIKDYYVSRKQNTDVQQIPAVKEEIKKLREIQREQRFKEALTTDELANGQFTELVGKPKKRKEICNFVNNQGSSILKNYPRANKVFSKPYKIAAAFAIIVGVASIAFGGWALVVPALLLITKVAAFAAGGALSIGGAVLSKKICSNNRNALLPNFPARNGNGDAGLRIGSRN